MKIAIFGGTFDPIHKGHLNIILNLFNKLNIDKVIIVPTNVKYYKKNNLLFNYDERIAQCKKAISINNQFDNLDIEISEIERNIPDYEGYAYTVERVFEKYNGHDIYTVIGSDSYNYINTWRRYERILELSKLIVVTRPGSVIDSNMNIEYIPLLMNVDISSTEIRNKITKEEGFSIIDSWKL